MTEDERFKFCGEITMAARKIGIVLRERRTESGSIYYEFRDPDTHVVIKGAEDADRKLALTKACETLTKYLDPK